EYADWFVDPYNEIGLCTFSSPVTRLLFEHPDAPKSVQDDGGRCISAQVVNDTPEFPFTLTKPGEHESDNWNIGLHCVRHHAWHEVVLEALSPRIPDRDATCPTQPFSETASQLPDDTSFDAQGWTKKEEPNEGLWSVCGFPANAVVP